MKTKMLIHSLDGLLIKTYSLSTAAGLSYISVDAGMLSPGMLNNTSLDADKTAGRYIDLIMEYNDNQDNGYYKLIERGIPLTKEQKKEWKDNKVSDHFPYFVKVKMK